MISKASSHNFISMCKYDNNANLLALILLISDKTDKGSLG